MIKIGYAQGALWDILWSLVIEEASNLDFQPQEIAICREPEIHTQTQPQALPIHWHVKGMHMLCVRLRSNRGVTLYVDRCTWPQKLTK